MLQETKLREEGIYVLGIQRRDGTYVGNPMGETRLQEGDSLVLYGRIRAIQELDRRKSGYRGDREHRQAVAEQQEVIEEEIKQDAGADKVRMPPDQTV